MKRSKPLARRTPSQRKSLMRRRSKTNSYARRPRNREHMLLVKKLPCSVRTFQHAIEADGLGSFELTLKIVSTVFTPCRGWVQADHGTNNGMGRKGPDEKVIPLCVGHHDERTGKVGGRGSFDGWSSEDMKLWLVWAVEETQGQVMQMMEYR